MNFMNIIQGLSSKKLMLVMFVVYLLSDLAAKSPENAMVSIYIMAGLTGFFLGCQTILDWKNSIHAADSGDTVVTEIKPE